MMVSPEQFAPISFQQIETSESFSFTQQRRNDDNDKAPLPPPLPSNSSFFEEVSPQQEDAENVHEHHHQHHQRHGSSSSYREEGNGHEERSGSGGRSSQASSLAQQQQPPNSLPTVIVLSVEGEEEGNNNRNNGPPMCVGVQNAGISHVNGLYALAPNNHQDDYSESQQQQPSPNNDIPPLYFLEAEPILLSDKRYYDMCILRIDCPDSPEEYVIWFISRVDIDPECLDVKFSDCYYYCRVLRSVGLDVPPMEGWNVPDTVQQQHRQPQQYGGAVEYTTVEGDEDDSLVEERHRVENDHDVRLHDSSMSSGLGIVPRTAQDDYV